MKKTLHLLFPSGIFAAAVITVLFTETAKETLMNLSGYIFITSAALSLFFSFRLGRTRHFFTAILLFIVCSASFLIIPDLEKDIFLKELIIYNSVSFFLPLHIVLFAWWRERGILNIRGALRLLWILVFPFMLWLAVSEKWIEFFPLFANQMKQSFYFSQLKLAPLPLAAFIFSFLLLLFFYLRDNTPAKSGFIWVLVMVFTAIAFFRGHTFFTLMIAGAFLTLLISIIETSHFIAYRDELTGLPARRALNEQLQKLGRNYSIAMADIDHFKKFNDKYGHDVGDEVLRMVASKLNFSSGKVYRYGGEEFTIIYSGKATEDIAEDAEKTRKNVESEKFTIRKPLRKKGKKSGKKIASGERKSVSVTVSIGIARRDGKAKNPQDVLKKADKALYKAKKKGRNRVEKI